MTDTEFGQSTRFFRSFIAAELPVVPIDEATPDQIEPLVSFYAADFDDSGRLVLFRKYLNTQDNDQVLRELVFADSYEYEPNGNLKSRTMTRAEGNESRWFFLRDNAPVNEIWWSSEYANNQLSDVESELTLRALNLEPVGSEFAFTTGSEFINSATSILRIFTHDTLLRLLAILPDGKKNWRVLPNHADLGLPLSPLIDQLETKLLMSDAPVVLPSLSDLLEVMPKEDDWAAAFAAENIRALEAIPIRMRVLEGTPVAIMMVLASVDWSPALCRAVTSMLQRITTFFELLLEIGRRREPISEESPSKWSQ